MIVLKFGGTSVEDAPAIRRAVEIVWSRRDRRPLVVVSAIARATNTLLRIGESALTGATREAQEILAELMSRHRWILFDLGLGMETEREMAEAMTRHAEELGDFIRGVVLLRELTPRVQDAMVGHGERLSTGLFAAAAGARGLDVDLVDAREVMVTDARFGRARPDMAAIEARARRIIAPGLDTGRVVITQGFVGATSDGTPTTLGRGGSDYSASLLGAALGADAIEIWTDVDGMLTADCRVVPESMKIREVSFVEAAELAYFGAKVLHPATIEPAVTRNIPVRILNSRRPSGTGTTITARSERKGVPVKSVASKRRVAMLRVESLRSLAAHGFLRAVFEVLDRHETHVDLVSTSEASVSLALDDTRSLDGVAEDLSRFARVSLERNCAIVCLVGEELGRTPGTAARAFAALGDINALLIAQGASEINLPFVVRDEDADESVRRLHAEFLGRTDRRDVFEPLDVEVRP